MLSQTSATMKKRRSAKPLVIRRSPSCSSAPPGRRGRSITCSSTSAFQYNDCARNGFGATFCGDELTEYKQRMGIVDTDESNMTREEHYNGTP